MELKKWRGTFANKPIVLQRNGTSFVLSARIALSFSCYLCLFLVLPTLSPPFLLFCHGLPLASWILITSKQNTKRGEKRISFKAPPEPANLLLFKILTFLYTWRSPPYAEFNRNLQKYLLKCTDLVKICGRFPPNLQKCCWKLRDCLSTHGSWKETPFSSSDLTNRLLSLSDCIMGEIILHLFKSWFYNVLFFLLLLCGLHFG